MKALAKEKAREEKRKKERKDGGGREEEREQRNRNQPFGHVAPLRRAVASALSSAMKAVVRAIGLVR